MEKIKNFFRNAKNQINFKIIKSFFLISIVFILIIAIVFSRTHLSVAKPQNIAKEALTQEQPKVRVLIVPGHEPDFGGTEFSNVKERDLAVELGQDLQKLLQVDDRYQVFITRDDRAWDPTFVDYFAKNWNNIAAWEKLARQKMQYLISVGLMTKPTPTIIHDNAPKNVAQRLYGITKWSNENNINVMIHIHFNDYTGRRWNRVGKYSGFAIYVPAPQFSNSSISHDIAQDIYKKLAEHNKVSNFPLEASGIIDEPGLIALGENNTSNAASVLIEYGYIYEKQFTDPKLRSQSLQDLAQQTFSGLQDYFNQNNNK